MIIVDILELSRIFICHNKFETRLCLREIRLGE